MCTIDIHLFLKDYVVTKVEVTDADQKDLDNSKISIEITNIRAVTGAIDPPKDLFIVERGDKPSPASFDLKVGTNLEPYYGEYEVAIKVNFFKNFHSVNMR